MVNEIEVCLPRAQVTAPFRSVLFRAGMLAGVVCAGVLLVFVLPLFVPSAPVRGISASYLAGFNNSVAVVGAAGLSVIVLLLTMWLQRRDRLTITSLRTEREVSWIFTGAVIVCTSAILAVIAKVVIGAQERYLGDAGYIIEQASTWNETGRRLYSQIEFAYGPLLLLPEVWISRLTHIGITEAYYIAYIVEFACGVCMLAYVVNRLPMRYHLRQFAVVVFALGAITPHLGVNYTFFRFVSPLAFFLFATGTAKRAWQCAALFGLVIALELAISPELGFALLLGMVTYACLRAWQNGVAWLAAGAGAIIVLSVLLGTFGRGYLRMVALFSHGVYNLPVGPYPHVLILLFALVWIVPVYLGRTLLLTRVTDARLLSFYVIALAMISPALSRCDPLHVFFDGIGIFLLSLAAMSHVARPGRLVWAGCVVLLVLWEQRVNESMFAWRTALTVQKVIVPRTPFALRSALLHLVALPNRVIVAAALSAPAEHDVIPDKQALDSMLADATVATPLEVSPAWEAALKRSGHYSPLYRAFGVDMMDEASEKASVQELNSYGWMLLPTERSLKSYQQLPEGVGPIQGVRMYFRLRNAVLFVPGAVFEENVRERWLAEARFGAYTLYRRIGGG